MSSNSRHIVHNEGLVSSKRYEIKIPFPAVQTPEVMAWIRLHPEQWRVAYHPRQVNNIYFDTNNSANLNDNIDGVIERNKLRIRWYGGQIERVKTSHFEIKHKMGLIGWKRIYPIPGMLNLLDCSWYEIISHLRSCAQNASVLLQRYPIPMIINSYYRKYYTSLDNKLRLTVDTRLVSYSQLASRLPNLHRPSLPQPFTIVEIKTHPDNAERLTQVLSHSTSRVSRFSKYVNALMASPS